MNCTNCGFNLNPGTKFCTRCGTAVAAAPVTPPAATPAVTPVAAPVATPVATSTAVPAAPVTSSKGANFDFSSNTATPATGKRYEYKVLSQKDKWFSGKFDPAILEQAMNAYAQQGWRVIGCATADIPGFGGPRQEFVTVMEREV